MDYYFVIYDMNFEEYQEDFTASVESAHSPFPTCWLEVKGNRLSKQKHLKQKAREGSKPWKSEYHIKGKQGTHQPSYTKMNKQSYAKMNKTKVFRHRNKRP